MSVQLVLTLEYDKNFSYIGMQSPSTIQIHLTITFFSRNFPKNLLFNLLLQWYPTDLRFLLTYREFFASLYMTQKEKWREKNSVILLKALKLQNELNQKHEISTLLLRTHEILFCINIFPSIPCHFHQHKNIFKITHLKKEERKNPH